MASPNVGQATCFSSRSAMECTATVRIPNSRQARRMRSAISPRLAMMTLVSIGSGPPSGGRADEGVEAA